jgi:hypothetical protein
MRGEQAPASGPYGRFPARHFLAHPQKAPNIPDRIHAHPDDRTEDGSTWRRLVAEYNKNPGNNPLGLYPAFELYERDVYRRLVDKFDLKNVYIPPDEITVRCSTGNE